MSKRRAKALVSTRLAALGHDDDFMSEAALDELRARAGHADTAFGAALGAVLFLAATEDAPRIESHHVEQAVSFGDAIFAGPRRPPGWRAWQIAATGFGGAACGALLAFVLTHHRTPAAPPATRPAERPHSVATAPGTSAAHQSKPPSAPPAAPPQASSIPAAVAPPSLPVEPPLRVSLVVPAGDRETATHAAQIASRLRQAGLGYVQVESINATRKDTGALRHHVVYFFSQDIALAQNVASALDLSEDSSHIRNPWVPVLAPGAAGATSHPPGSIDVFAP